MKDLSVTNEIETGSTPEGAVKRSKYIPGFDWVKLFGSVFVMISHYDVFKPAQAEFPIITQMLYNLVPIFFLISAYLNGRSFSKQKIRKQVLKYGSFCLFLNSGYLFCHYLPQIINYGAKHILVLIVRILKSMVFGGDIFRQLWFIPVLIYAMILNAFFDERKRRIFIAICGIMILLITIIGDEPILKELNNLLAAFPILKKVTYAEELLKYLKHYLVGLLYTSMGYEFAKAEINIKYLLISLCPVMMIELFFKYFGITPILLSVLLFFLIKKLPGSFLYSYHLEVSIFSGIMFFLHMFEKMIIYDHITDNIAINVITIIVINLAITIAICSIIRKRSAKPDEILQADRAFTQGSYS